MTIKRSTYISAEKIPKVILTSILVSLLITVACTAIAAYLLVSERVGEESIKYISLTILFTASTAGAFAAWISSTQNRLLICLANGGIYFLSLIATTALLFGGQYKGVGATALVVLAGTLSVVLLGTTIPERQNKRTRH